MKRYLFLAVVCGLLLAGCAADAKLGKGGFGCEEGEDVRTELYFGLSKTGGGYISESQWEEFAGKYITPRFKKGLTIVDANGQWMGENRKLIKEKTKIVILVHSNSKEAEEAIEDIRNKYKEFLGQESVLRVSDCVDVSF
jgi:hypothetical protein